MNIYNLLARGSAHAPSDSDRYQDRITKAAEQSRKQWLNALMTDQTRAWMSIGEQNIEVINAFAVVLTLAGFVHVYDKRTADTPELSVIRGAISAAGQCVKAGGVISLADARAFSSAAQRAESIIKSGTVSAIVHACKTMQETVK